MIVILDIRELSCGLDTKTDDIMLDHVNMSMNRIAKAHIIAVTNGKELRLLKYRGFPNDHMLALGTYSINMLPILLYFGQESMETGSVDLYRWIEILSGKLKSKQLSDLSKKFEKRAVEIA